MLSASSILNKKNLLFIALTLGFVGVNAQENSPFSRFAIGNLTNTQNSINKGMGGLSVAWADGQGINLDNPAAFANARIVTYDIGVMIDSRTLNSKLPLQKYNSANFSPSYLAVSSPINTAKKIGFAFGFKPYSRINYSLIRNERLSNIDSTQTLFEGTGGLNEAFIGLGKKWGRIDSGMGAIALGFNTGYRFGRKETSTKRTFINDTVAYYKANYTTTTSFTGAFFNAGFQYETLLLTDTSSKKTTGFTKRYSLRIGGNAAFAQTLNARQNFTKETFDYDFNGATFTIDSLQKGNDVRGKIKIPGTYTAGFVLQKTINDQFSFYDVWALGVDFVTAKWSDYSFYNQKDATVNSWQIKVGAQWTPNAKDARNYFNRVTYRAGFNTGKDYINADGNELKNYTISFGLGLPVRPPRFSYQFTTINTAFEFGRRGSAVNNITEGFFKFTLGLCLSDFWYIKRRYD